MRGDQVPAGGTRSPFADRLGRVSTDDLACRHVLGDHAAGGRDRIGMDHLDPPEQ